MTLLVVGISHHLAEASVLERVALAQEARRALGERLVSGGTVKEALVLSTCNRTEVYADAVTFHGAIAELTSAFVDLTGSEKDELADNVYVHYEDRAISHAFAVAGGLDSMAVGECQILGQMREALKDAQSWRLVGPSLNGLLQHALRVGKRVHTETAIDTVSVSLIEAGLNIAARTGVPVAGRNVLVVGAGGIASLAATTVARRGGAKLYVTNRTLDRAERLADRVDGVALPLSELAPAVADADIVLSGTGARDVVVTEALVQEAMAERPGRPLVLIDLALPHDIDLAAGRVSGVTRVGLDELRAELAGEQALPEVDAALDLVTQEVGAFLAAREADQVGPIIKEIRTRAAEVVRAELDRFDHHAPDLTPAQRVEVGKTVHRVVEKLLHTPTVRVKELSVGASGSLYADALRELFELDNEVPAVMSTPAAREAGGL